MKTSFLIFTLLFILSPLVYSSKNDTEIDKDIMIVNALYDKNENILSEITIENLDRIVQKVKVDFDNAPDEIVQTRIIDSHQKFIKKFDLSYDGILRQSTVYVMKELYNGFWINDMTEESSMSHRDDIGTIILPYLKGDEDITVELISQREKYLKSRTIDTIWENKFERKIQKIISDIETHVFFNGKRYEDVITPLKLSIQNKENDFVRTIDLDYYSDIQISTFGCEYYFTTKLKELFLNHYDYLKEIGRLEFARRRFPLSRHNYLLMNDIEYKN
jgi:hypothetical protein